MQWPKYIAHRGASAIAPENTIEALNLAIELGAKCVEFDLQPTKEGALAVFHDKTLVKASGIDQRTSEFTLEELQQTEALYNFGPQTPPIYIASFDQYLQVLTDSDLLLNCEIKCFQGGGKHTASHLEGYIDQLMQLESRCLLTSSCKQCLRIARNHMPNMHLGLVTRKTDQNTFDFAQELELVSLSIHKNFICEETIRLATEHQLAIMAYTVNDFTQAQTLLSKGVTSIFSDVIY
jgi:glycerophosphoryl diester phosphodiesterase